MFRAVWLVTMVMAVAACGAETEDDGLDPVETAEVDGLTIPVHSVAGAYWSAVYQTPVTDNPHTNPSLCFLPGTEPMLLGAAVVSLDGHLPELRLRGGRVCSTRAGEPLVLPLYTVSADGVGRGGRVVPRTLFLEVMDAMRQVRQLRVTVDNQDPRAYGAAITRSGPRTFAYELPELEAIYETPDGTLDVGPAVADGYFLRIPALPRGRHVIRVSGVRREGPFQMEYRIDAI